MRRMAIWLVLVAWAGAGHAQGVEGETNGSGSSTAGSGGSATTSAETTPAPPHASDSTQVEVEKEERPEAGTAAATGDAAYQRKIKGLEERVNDLKEKIFRSKTRLAILKESVLASTIAGAEAQIVHRNEMGSSFRLEKVSYNLDGGPIFSEVDKGGALDEREEIEIFTGPIVPGNHTVSVVMVYRGHGYGIFSYLEGYVFRLRSSHTFYAEEGKVSRIHVVGYEKGGITTDLKERPDIRFDTRITDAERKPQTAAVSRKSVPEK